MFASRSELLAILRPGLICAEVGVDEGYFSREVMQCVAPKELHLFDLRPLPEVTGATPHNGDSATEMAKMPNNYFDWIFVDGDHTILGVQRDVEAAIPKLKALGILAFHDYILFDHIANHSPYGVIHEVNRLCNEGWQMVAFALEEKMFCSVALQRNHGGQQC